MLNSAVHKVTSGH